jgi:hypothetical protein
MKKILGLTLASLALAALSTSSYAGYSGRFGGSVRGDVGKLDSQVPYFGVDNIVDSTAYTSDVITFYSNRNKWTWDFTGRIFAYLNCSPCDLCPIYVAASWQGSNHTIDSNICPFTASADEVAIIPIRAHGKAGFLQAFGTVQVTTNVLSGTGTEGDPFILTPSVTTITAYDAVEARVSVHNEFSKAKLGLGLDMIKTSCFGLTLEIGANYLDAKLRTDKRYDLTASPTPASSTIELLSPLAPLSTITIQTGNIIVAPTFSDNLGLAPLANSDPSATTPPPYDFVFLINEQDHTQGFGLYASLKGEYKFRMGCLGDCWSVYGKAEVADIIGRQNYHYDFCYMDHFAAAPDADRIYNLEEHPDHQYNNIVEVDLEAALVYSPRFKCWNELAVSLALGVRTDSFLNMFSHLTYENNQSMWNLTRPSLFVELGIKI